MKFIRTLFVLCGLLVATSTFAEAPDDYTQQQCHFRSRVAYTALYCKELGLPLEETKKLFHTWVFGDANGERFQGLTPTEANMIVFWYNDWSGDTMEAWFEYVYNTYPDKDVAEATELQKCLETNNVRPYFKDLK